MSQIDPVFAAVTAAGTPFELADHDGMLQFAKAAPDLNLMIEHARRHGDKTFLVDFSSDGTERRLTFRAGLCLARSADADAAHQAR